MQEIFVNQIFLHSVNIQQRKRDVHYDACYKIMGITLWTVLVFLKPISLLSVGEFFFYPRSALKSWQYILWLMNLILDNK